jgi:predicted RNA methylase
MDARALDEIDLLRSAGLGESSVVVDLGTGTGQFALTATWTSATPPLSMRDRTVVR